MFSESEILAWAREAAASYADALNIMTTSRYSIGNGMELGFAVRLL